MSRRELRRAELQRQARQRLVLYLPHECRPQIEELIEQIRSLPPSETLLSLRQCVIDWATRYHLAKPFNFHIGEGPPSLEYGHWLVERLVAEVFSHRLRDRDFDRLLDPDPRWGFLWHTYQDYQSTAREQADALLHQWSKFVNPFEDVPLKDLPRDWDQQVRIAAVLSPIEADPTRQTWEDFQKLAKRHFQTRSAKLAEAGFAAYHAAPALERDIRYFLRFQVCRHSARRIDNGGKGRVENSYRRIAELLELPLRTSL